MKITSRFGDSRPGLDPSTHQGVDYTNGYGAEVLVSLEGGKMIRRGDFSYAYRQGKLVKVSDFTAVIEGARFFHVYAHLQKLFVKVGDAVDIDFLLGFQTDHVHRGLFEKRGSWKSITQAERSGWAIDPLPYLTGEMAKINELEKEIQRLANREKELVNWLTDCNAKREEVLRWNQENEEKARGLENALKAAQAENQALNQTKSFLEVEQTGLKKEIEGWKHKFIQITQTETSLQETLQKLRAERDTERTENHRVILDLRKKLQGQEATLEELKKEIEPKEVIELPGKIAFQHTLKVLIYVAVSGAIAALITFFQGKEIPTQYAGIVVVANLVLVALKKYLDEKKGTV